MVFPIRFLLPGILLAALAGLPDAVQAASADADAQCPFGAKGRDFDGLLLCVPQDNDRYTFTADGFDWMAWSGEEPVARPASGSAPAGDGAELTLGRAWIGEAVLGVADSASGKKGFDHFMTLIAESILKAGAGAAAGADFPADVPVDESGLVQRFMFSYAQPDLLVGERVDKTDPGPGFVLFRPSSGAENPHLALCRGGQQGMPAVHLCMSLYDVGGHRAGIMVTGTDLARSFRIAEGIATDLASFVIAAPPQ